MEQGTQKELEIGGRDENDVDTVFMYEVHIWSENRFNECIWMAKL